MHAASNTPAACTLSGRAAPDSDAVPCRRAARRPALASCRHARRISASAAGVPRVHLASRALALEILGCRPAHVTAAPALHQLSVATTCKAS
jgi:hypothetical protein